MNKELKWTKEHVELRRGKVLELSAQGYNQAEISKTLNVSTALISLDMQYIREQAQASIRSYIDVKLPEEYNKCLSGLNSILKESWEISKTADNREKIQALSLAKECYNAKLSLLTDVQVVEDVIKFVNKSKTLAPIDTKVEQEREEPKSKHLPFGEEEQEPSPLEEEPIQEAGEEE